MSPTPAAGDVSDPQVKPVKNTCSLSARRILRSVHHLTSVRSLTSHSNGVLAHVYIRPMDWVLILPIFALRTPNPNPCLQLDWSWILYVRTAVREPGMLRRFFFNPQVEKIKLFLYLLSLGY